MSVSMDTCLKLSPRASLLKITGSVSGKYRWDDGRVQSHNNNSLETSKPMLKVNYGVTIWKMIDEWLQRYILFLINFLILINWQVLLSAWNEDIIIKNNDTLCHFYSHDDNCIIFLYWTIFFDALFNAFLSYHTMSVPVLLSVPIVENFNFLTTPL